MGTLAGHGYGKKTCYKKEGVQTNGIPEPQMFFRIKQIQASLGTEPSVEEKQLYLVKG